MFISRKSVIAELVITLSAYFGIIPLFDACSDGIIPLFTPYFNGIIPLFEPKMKEKVLKACVIN